MLASVRYVDLGRVGESHPIVARAPRRFSRQPGPVVEATSTAKATLDRGSRNRPSLIRSPSPVPRALVGNNLTG